jgi:virulence factor Mce-like protein
MTKRFMWTAVLIVVAVVASAFTIADARNDERYVTAYFDRAVQIFPGNSVRVLGVDIGRVTEVEVDGDQSRVAVTFKIEDEDVKLPDDVEATLIPVSLLGERYVQLFPAYEAGPTFDGDEIAMDRTSVPVEQDELLRSLQDYFGELDPERVAKVRIERIRHPQRQWRGAQPVDRKRFQRHRDAFEQEGHAVRANRQLQRRHANAQEPAE